jgi:hypothetical protein
MNEWCVVARVLMSKTVSKFGNGKIRKIETDSSFGVWNVGNCF